MKCEFKRVGRLLLHRHLFCVSLFVCESGSPGEAALLPRSEIAATIIGRWVANYKLNCYWRFNFS